VLIAQCSSAAGSDVQEPRAQQAATASFVHCSTVPPDGAVLVMYAAPPTPIQPAGVPMVSVPPMQVLFSPSTQPAKAWRPGTACAFSTTSSLQRQPAFALAVQVNGFAGFVQHFAALGVAPGTAVCPAGQAFA
jgi:hypothetical protein